MKFDIPPVDNFMNPEGNNISSSWKKWLTSLSSTVKDNLSDDGFTLPSGTNDTLDALEEKQESAEKNRAFNDPRIIFNSDSNRVVHNLGDGDYREIQEKLDEPYDITKPIVDPDTGIATDDFKQFLEQFYDSRKVKETA